MMKLRNVLIISIIVLISLFFVAPVFAEDMCLPQDTVGQMTVDLEKCQLLRERYGLLEQANTELETQVALLEKINDLQKEQLQVLKETTQQYRDLIETQGKMYQEAIKASKPGFFQELFKITGSLGIGAVLALILML